MISGLTALKWCVFTNSIGLFLAGAIFIDDKAVLALMVYFVHALLVAPLLFLISIFKAPRGTFRWNWPAKDDQVFSYRCLFWGNLILVLVLSGVVIGQGWGALLSFPALLLQ